MSAKELTVDGVRTGLQAGRFCCVNWWRATKPPQNDIKLYWIILPKKIYKMSKRIKDFKTESSRRFILRGKWDEVKSKPWHRTDFLFYVTNKI